jgi:hypothetical protein
VVAQFLTSTDVAADLWPAACSGRIELSELQGRVSIIGIDRGVQQGYVAVLGGKVIAIRCQAVEPPHVHLPILHFATTKQFQQKRFVTCAALDNNPGVLKRSSET